MLSPTSGARLQCEAGIALGPILFIIAILAILAAAIASGPGSFNASTNTEGDKAKASAIVQVGDNLKVGMDRLITENGVNYNGWTISPVNTSNNTYLFSPIGGGIVTAKRKKPARIRCILPMVSSQIPLRSTKREIIAGRMSQSATLPTDLPNAIRIAFSVAKRMPRPRLCAT